MTQLLLIVCEYLLFKSTFGGCGTSGDRRLGIEVNDDTTWAGSNGKFFANIYATIDLNKRWNGWRNLDNLNCNDREVGAVDYFDDFESITDEWEGIAIYTCTNDGLIIETLHYWDGSNQKIMNYWEPGVFGPFPDNCVYNDATNADSQEELNSFYSDILIDGNTEGCHGAIFHPDGSLGKVWTERLPGPPDCSATEYGADIPAFRHNDDDDFPSRKSPVTTITSNIFEQQLLNYLGIGIALLLFVSNSCLITVIVRNNHSNKVYQHSKVYKTDTE